VAEKLTTVHETGFLVLKRLEQKLEPSFRLERMDPSLSSLSKISIVHVCAKTLFKRLSFKKLRSAVD
jgi:hypothetical protein